MADNEAAGKSFSELLFTDGNVGLDIDSCYNYNTSFSPQYSPNLLCFGDISCSVFDKSSQEDPLIACNDSSKLNKKRNGVVNESSTGAGAPANVPVNSKKVKSERSNMTGHGKRKREKLGERITALQQLVSPYGKTDTASVLHEAMGYIKFLQDQVQVLCSPYLQVKDDVDGDQVRKDLRSMGLCLVPVECTSVVANDNGADYWSPAMAKNLSPN